MRNIFNWLLALLLVSTIACSPDSAHESKYMRWVGDSEFDPAIDDSTWQICNYELIVKQYFNFSEGFKYTGEKTALIAAFDNGYTPVETDQSGWIRIRFVVNCKGEAGRFRITQSDKDYKETVFDNQITSQLLEITKSLDGWVPLPTGDVHEDYYLYLIFKIENGQIIEILP